jgi:hypothetical protein
MNTPNMAVALMPMKRRTKRLPLLSGFLRESRRRAGALAIITGTLLTTFAIAPRGAMAADATPTDDSAYATVNGHIVTKRDETSCAGSKLCRSVSIVECANYASMHP